MNTKNSMSFISISDNPEFLEYNKSPISAKDAIPDWYKDLGGYKQSSSKSISNLRPVNDRGNDGSDVSTKLCPPFLDAMISGYVQPLSEDLTVEVDKLGKPTISWQSRFAILDSRPKVDMPIPKECYPVQFGWKMFWYYKTPPGYSLLITHPMNRFDLPFYVPSAIVDSDIWGLPVFIPFFLKRDFIGTIEAGTPLFQMLPIKRDDWELDIDTSPESINEHRIREEKRGSHVTGHYKKTTWQKKNY